MLVRLALILVTRRWGLIVVGAILAVVGLIVGFTSHGVTYQRVPQGTIAHFLAPGHQWYQNLCQWGFDLLDL